MKLTIKITCAFLALLGLLFVACSKDDNQDPYGPAASTSSIPTVILKEADAVIDNYLTHYDTLESLEQLASWFSSSQHISSAIVCDDALSVSMIFSSGLRANYTLRTTYLGSKSADLSKSVKPKLSIMEAGDAKIVKVFDGNTTRDQQVVAETIDNLTHSLEELGYSVTNYNSTTTTMDISFFRTLFRNAPPVLVIFTHGIDHSTDTETRYGIATREEVPDEMEVDSSEMNTYGIVRLRSEERTYWTLLRDFANSYFNSYGKCYFSLHACNVAQDNELIQGFLNQPDTIVLLAHTRSARFDQIRTLTRNMYTSLTDTFTIQQAYDHLSNNYHTSLYSKPDADIMLAETFLSSNYGPAREHFIVDYHDSETGNEDGIRIPSYTISSNVCASGEMGCDSIIAIVVPRAPGTYQLTDGVVIVLFEGGAEFAAALNCRGVSGTVTINAPQNGILSGGYSATVGIWQGALIPSENDPSDTRNIQGYFKIN
jgi:hypothetical protein